MRIIKLLPAVALAFVVTSGLTLATSASAEVRSVEDSRASFLLWSEPWPTSRVMAAALSGEVVTSPELVAEGELMGHVDRGDSALLLIAEPDGALALHDVTIAYLPGDDFVIDQRVPGVLAPRDAGAARLGTPHLVRTDEVTSLVVWSENPRSPRIMVAAVHEGWLSDPTFLADGVLLDVAARHDGLSLLLAGPDGGLTHAAVALSILPFDDIFVGRISRRELETHGAAPDFDLLEASTMEAPSGWAIAWPETGAAGRGLRVALFRPDGALTSAEWIPGELVAWGVVGDSLQLVVVRDTEIVAVSAIFLPDGPVDLRGSEEGVGAAGISLPDRPDDLLSLPDQPDGFISLPDQPDDLFRIRETSLGELNGAGGGRDDTHAASVDSLASARLALHEVRASRGVEDDASRLVLTWWTSPRELRFVELGPDAPILPVQTLEADHGGAYSPALLNEALRAVRDRERNESPAEPRIMTVSMGDGATSAPVLVADGVLVGQADLREQTLLLIVEPDGGMKPLGADRSPLESPRHGP